MEGGSAARVLRDVLPPRPCWADLQDSSQENNQDSQPGPPLSQGSYNDPLEDSQDHSRASLLESLECAAVLKSPAAGGVAANPGGGGATMTRELERRAHDGSKPDAAMGLGMLPSLAEGIEAPASSPMAPLSWRLRSWRGGGQREVAGGGQAAPPSSLPPTTPVRRRRRNEIEVPSSILTPLGKRSRGGPPPPPPAVDVSKEDWARRLQKRRASIAAIKRMPEYAAVAEVRLSSATRQEEVPLTPEPDDSTVSKRQWEAAVMNWRALLKRLALPPCIDLDSS
mmetsp:Transcript_107588/g.286317  ORF Transcript_107588/g.286317 Transcript_107588/m.286317 type:complete len:282 (-) Transcript_107588:57-902(-)